MSAATHAFPLLMQKEWVAAWREGRLLTLGVGLLLVFAVLFAISAQDARRLSAEREQVGATAMEQWQRQGAKHPHRAAHYGIYAFKPQTALAAIDPGIGSQTGQTLWLEPHKRNMSAAAPASDESVAQRIARLVPSFVLVTLVPLLIIGLGHHIVSQERESGTMRMLHGAGVRGPALLFSKWLGLLLSISAFILPALVLGCALMLSLQTGTGPTGAGQTGAGQPLARLFAMVLLLLLYYAVCAALTVFVSSRVKTSRASLLVLLAGWLLCVFLGPGLSAALTERAMPLPTAHEFWSGIAHDIRNGLPGDGDAKAREKAFETELMRQHGVERMEDVPIGVNAQSRLTRDAYAARVHRLHFENFWSRLEAQQSRLRLASLLSPALPMTMASMSLAGTDLMHQRDFEDSAEQYREDFTRRIDEWDRDSTQGLVSYEKRYGDNEQWMSIPDFSYRPPGVGFALRGSVVDVVWLLGWLAVSALALIWSGRRLEP